MNLLPARKRVVPCRLLAFDERADCGRSRLLFLLFLFFVTDVEDMLGTFLPPVLLGRALLGLCFIRGEALRVSASTLLAFAEGVWPSAMSLPPRTILHLELTRTTPS